MKKYLFLLIISYNIYGWSCGDSDACSIFIRSLRHESVAFPTLDFREEALRIINQQYGPIEEERNEESSSFDSLVNTQEQTKKEFWLAVCGKDNALALREEFSICLEMFYKPIRDKLENQRHEYGIRYDSDEDEAVFELDQNRLDAIIEKIPKEFASYFRGAIAYRNRDFNQAIGFFNSILELPPEERKFRSTWAAFMLGKSWTELDPARAPEYFAMTRELAASGYRDSLELANESCGWQARAEVRAKRYVEAMHNYARNAQLLSIKFVINKVFQDKVGISDLASDAFCRRIVTAYQMSGYNCRYSDEWFAALGRIDTDTLLPEAEYLCWAAYRGGNMQAAEFWMNHSSPESPYANLVRFKLLLRDGLFEQAEAFLESSLLSLKTIQINKSEFGCFLHDFSKDDGYISSFGDLATAYLMAEKFDKAIFLFLKVSYIDDVILIADRVMTLNELRSFIENNENKFNADESVETMRPDKCKKSDLALIKHILAQRLASLGEWEQAIPYFPEEYSGRNYDYSYNNKEPYNLKTIAIDVAGHLKKTKDTSLTTRERAESVFEAARIISENGNELLDNYCGIYDSRDSEYEKNENISKRIANSGIFNKQYKSVSSMYVEYLVADMMWQCAEMLPNNDVLTAHALFYGGTLLKRNYQNPNDADKFYKALVCRNPNLLIAQQADKRRWFPDEFTDVVLYHPRPKPHFYQRKRNLAIIAGGVLAIALLVTGSYHVINRKKRPRALRGDFVGI